MSARNGLEQTSATRSLQKELARQKLELRSITEKVSISRKALAEIAEQKDMGAESDEKVETQPKQTEDFTFQPRTSGSAQPALRPNPYSRQPSASLPQPKTPSHGERDRSKVQFLLGDSSSGEESVSVSSSKKVSTSAKEAPTATIHKSASTGGSMGAGNTDNLQEQNRRLMEENQRLQRENKRLKETLRLEELPARVREVEERNTQLTRENSRLQSKLLGLNLSEPGSRASMSSLASEGPDAIARLQSIGSMSAMIDELQAENEQAQEDIDKLVSYVEYLERKGKPIARDANQSALLETLRKENAVVREQLENKNKELVQVQTQLEKGIKGVSFWIDVTPQNVQWKCHRA